VFPEYDACFCSAAHLVVATLDAQLERAIDGWVVGITKAANREHDGVLARLFAIRKR